MEVIMRHQKTIVFTLAAVAILFAVGFAHAATEVHFWHAFSPDIKLGKVLIRYTEEFNASQQEYKIVPTYKGTYDDAINAAIAAYRAGKQPTIVQIHAPGAPTLLTSGAVKPVQDILEAAGYDIDWSRYIGPVMAMYKDGGKQVAMPFNTSTPLLWYNKDAFAKAGIASVPATWQELEEAARKLLKAGFSTPVTSSWQEWVLLKNYSFVEDQPIATQGNGMDGLDAQFVMNKTSFVNHMDRIQRWIKEGLYGYMGRKWTGAHEAFYAGKTVILLESSAGYGGISQHAKFEFGAGFLPHEVANPSPRNSFIGGAGLFVMKGLSDAEYNGAAAFFKFLSSPEKQFDWHQNSGYVPITLDAYELAKSSGYYETYPHQELAILQLNRGTPTVNTRGIRLGYLVQIDEIINEEMENIWSMKKTAQEAADDMVRRGNPLLKRFAKTVGQ
jgi:sn-glycerol 3-phosphate transport system substrate-binding protein